ncbi:MAG: CHASE2 domain-containing protein [Pseudomonadota bacterium]
MELPGLGTRLRRQLMQTTVFVRSHPIAMVFLLVLMASMLGSDGRVTRIVRESLFDGYQLLLPRERINDSVVVVAIDDASIEALGQWPWPRRLLAQLIDRIQQQQPAAIAIDGFFPEPDRQSPRQQAAALRAEHLDDLADALAKLPDDDALFAAALARATVVLGIGGVSRTPTEALSVGYRPLILQQGGDVQPGLPAFPALLRSVPLIDTAASGHGVLNNISADGITRGVPTLVNLAGSLQPGLAIETLRLAAGAERLQVQAAGSRMRSVQLGDWQIPTDADGLWRLHYSPFEQRPHLPVSALLDGSAPADVLRGRIVLIGYTALGLQDSISTPLGRMPGVESHAEAIDNLLDGRLIGRPHWAQWAERGLLLLISLLALLLVPRLRPSISGSGFIGLALLLLASGLGLFAWRGWLIDVANPLIEGSVVFAYVLVLTLMAAQAQRHQLREALAASREQQARLEGEMDAARRIQMGMLPEPQEELGEEPRLDLAACMHSARSVGGDLYDFGRLTADQVYFLIGDVSGKGLPASLFMALSKALIRNAAQHAEADPGRALSIANTAIARENPEFLFVTAVVAVLDLQTGRLAWSSAGHDAPYLLRAGQPPQRLRGESGPPLCVLEGYRYQSESLQLLPGDALVLITDGITEAESRDGKTFYGAERLSQCLARLGSDTRMSGVIAAMVSDVAAFAEGAEQSDDLTALALRWNGTRPH